MPQRETSPRRRAITPINPKLEKKLAMYIAAAAAAGVGLTNTAQAKVVYSPANITVPYPGCSPIDLNGDGVTDVNICLVYGDKSFQLFAGAPTGNDVRITPELTAAAGLFGVPVGPGEKFAGSYPVMYYKVLGYYGKPSSYAWVGPWANVKNRYLGVKFSVSGTTHFGWVRLSTSKTHNPVISGYAYETIPNVSIKDGAVSGTAEVGSILPSDLEGPVATPASLGMLARGAEGIAIWRRDEAVETSPTA
jgi:hypothetical protein